MVEKSFDIKELQDVVASWAYKTQILNDQTRF